MYAQALETAEHADAAGIGSLWLSEHHFFEDGYLPQPLVFAAALAARTTRARIGTAVLIAPLRAALAWGQDSMKLYDYAARGRPIVCTLGGLGPSAQIAGAGVCEARAAAEFADTRSHQVESW